MSLSLLVTLCLTEKEMTKMSVSDELEKLSKMKETGSISEEGFQAPGRSGSGGSRISTRSTVALFASAFCIFHLFGCDLLAGGDAITCGKACDAADYTACTCDASDPCGWARDGFCDEPACAEITPEPFYDPDCSVVDDGE